MEENNKNLNKKHISGIVHVLLSHSYAMFFCTVVLGVIFDIIFSIRVFNNIAYEYLGLALIFFGTLLIYWSQSTTRSVGKAISQERDVNFFLHGPYKYTRNPTNFGLTLSVLGLGFLIHSLFSVIFMVIAYIISKLVFMKKQDLILKERYGDVFDEYKKKVNNWL